MSSKKSNLQTPWRPFFGDQFRVGIALFPMTLEMVRWSNCWLLAHGDTLDLVHRPCGQPLVARWCCNYCGAQLQRETLRFS